MSQVKNMKEEALCCLETEMFKAIQLINFERGHRARDVCGESATKARTAG
jgi:hypothetical protein